MTWPIVATVLFGALLHATWNALIKSGADKAIDTALNQACGALLAMPIMLMVGLPRPEAWPYIFVSVVIHVGYYVALVGAYRNGDFGLTYPIMRGLAPVLVAVASGSLIAETPSAASWGGVCCIALGVALVGLARRNGSPGDGLHRGKAMAFALANAAIIALYTIVDGLGVRVSSGGDADGGLNTLRYVMLLFVLDGIAYPVLVWYRRGAAGRGPMLAYARQRWLTGSLGGGASIGSYAIALWAMTVAPVASVAALRETSVLFAAFIGTVLLREPFGAQRAVGTVVIVAGVMALRAG